MKASQGGEIGIVISAEDYIPHSSKPEDKAAAQRLRDFHMGWWVQLTNPPYHTSYLVISFMFFSLVPLL